MPKQKAKERNSHMRKIREDIFNVGVDDHDIDLFEGQYVVPNGMAYNSYVVKGKKVAVTDSVDARFVGQWLNNIEALGLTPDYLIVHHMEPDHSSGIRAFAEKYPNAVIVGNAKTFTIAEGYFGDDFADRRLVVKEGDELDLGGHTLKFVFAPMVHWPEVMMSFDAASGALFSADAFGKFGASDADEDWACEARRYYFGIVGKYGVQVQAVLKKAATLPIKVICPLHGPVLDDNLGYYLGLYNTWSAYEPEADGVVLAYTSVYGHTKEAVLLLENELRAAGVKKVALFDLARDDMAEAVEDAFKYGKIVFASTTYNGGVFPFMHTFLVTLAEHGWRNRKVAFVENGSWAPFAARTMKELLAPCKDLAFCDTGVTIRGALSPETKAQIAALAKELAKA